jgi:hypothetical protein
VLSAVDDTWVSLVFEELGVGAVFEVVNSRDSRMPEGAGPFITDCTIDGLNSRDVLAPPDDIEVVEDGTGVDDEEDNEELGFSKTF